MRGKADEPAGRGIHERCRAVGLAVASALGMRKEAVDMASGLTCAVAAQLRNLGLALSSARAQAAILLCACARARTATLPCSVCLLPRRRLGLLLRALRIAARGTSGRRRGTPGKANVSLPFAVIVFVCHLYRLVSCITRPSYKKDVQQMRTYAKTSVSGMDGSEPGAIKRRPPRAIESRHQNGRSHRVTPLAVRPKNGAVRFAVLPSVEPQAALLCQGRILKPRNKSARQNRPRKG